MRLSVRWLHDIKFCRAWILLRITCVAGGFCERVIFDGGATILFPSGPRGNSSHQSPRGFAAHVYCFATKKEALAREIPHHSFSLQAMGCRHSETLLLAADQNISLFQVTIGAVQQLLQHTETHSYYESCWRQYLVDQETIVQ